MDYQQYMQKRKTILKNAEKTTIIKNKSQNMHSIHVCALCGQILSKYLVRSHHYQSIRKYYHYTFADNQLSGSICYNSQTCYQYLKSKRK